MLTWPCVEVSPKDGSGLGEAKLQILVRLGRGHNCLDEVNSELLFISIGPPAQGGRANVELIGFVGELLGLPPSSSQVRIESGLTTRSKVLAISGLIHDKRALIWLLQSKVGQKSDARYAAQHLAAERKASDPDAVKKRKEVGEFRKLQEEAVGAGSALSSLARMAIAQEANAMKPLKSALIVKRVRTAEKSVPTLITAQQTVNAGAKTSLETEAAAEATSTGSTEPSPPTAGLGGLALYASSESEEEDE